MHDRPETFGLPAVADYKNDHTAKTVSKESLKAVQMDVLKNPAIWILGLSSASMYVARYGVNNWAILFLQEGKGYSLVAAGSVLSAYPIMGLFGAAVSGLVSDKLFNSKRNMPALIFGLMEIGALTVFLLTPAGNTVIDTAAMAVFGFALGALLCYLGGLMAVDISSKRAAGAAMGLIGMFSYLGAAFQDYVSGFLINANKIVENGVTTYNFDSMKYFWIGASVLSLLLAASVWKVKAKD